MCSIRIYGLWLGRVTFPPGNREQNLIFFSHAHFQRGIDRANKKAVSNAARVQRWTVLPTDLSVPGGELGPTMKIKRFAFNKKYSDALDNLYV